jgi:hypothetical protein
MKFEAEIPEYVDCTSMAKLMRVSRSRLYQLIDAGIVLSPVYLIANRRPVFTKDMALRNLQVKERNVGVNGQVIMFYASRQSCSSAAKPRTSPVEKVREEKMTTPKIQKHSQIMEDLEALGMDNIKAEQLEEAIQKCFPTGVEDVSDDEILRSVFRFMKRQNPEDKQRA